MLSVIHIHFVKEFLCTDRLTSAWWMTYDAEPTFTLSKRLLCTDRLTSAWWIMDDMWPCTLPDLRDLSYLCQTVSLH